MVESEKNYVDRAYLLFHLVSIVEAMKKVFIGKIGIKLHLQSLDLQGELIILIFLCNRMLSTKICYEFWIQQQSR